MIPQVIDGTLYFIEEKAMTTEPIAPDPEDTPDPNRYQHMPEDEDATNAPYPDTQPDADEDF